MFSSMFLVVKCCRRSLSIVFILVVSSAHLKHVSAIVKSNVFLSPHTTDKQNRNPKMLLSFVSRSVAFVCFKQRGAKMYSSSFRGIRFVSSKGGQGRGVFFPL